MPSLATADADLAEIDRHFARFIARFGGGNAVLRAAALLSRAVRKGHICLDLATVPDGETESDPQWPTLDEWRSELRLSRAVGAASDPTRTPLVLDGAGRLYLRRYYDYEQALAGELRKRAMPAAGDGEGRPGSPGNDEGADDQQTAVAAALNQRLTVISGGPGTGKTTTVVRILSRLLERNPATRIALAAPTGKAAARLEQAVREGWTRFAPPDAASFLERIPRAATLHRLLGSRPNSPEFRHHAGHPLAIDLVVVDEASMVPLPLMARFFDALPESARVVLLGDRDQLASVEPGSVLADIAEAAADPRGPLGKALVVLRKNYRFGNDSTIFSLCEAVRAGDSQTALGIVAAPARADLGGAPLPQPGALSDRLKEPVLAGFRAYLAETDPAKALASFAGFRLLSAVRGGPYGVLELNRRVEAILRGAKLSPGHAGAYAGMPVLITKNDYQIGLFNGDIGILLPDSADETPGEGREPALWAWFPGQSPDEPLRKVAPARLPNHEPAFAMTVHKSQGSEFENVLLVLPDRDSPILSRELIYTGLTRARKRVEVWFKADVFGTAVSRKTQRASGLREIMKDEPELR